MNLIVRKSDPGKGNGLFAARSFGQGERVLNQLSCEINAPLQFVNHSCDPNCELYLLLLIALRPIKEWEEITLDYATVGFKHKPMVFECLCGSKDCRQSISE